MKLVTLAIASAVLLTGCSTSTQKNAGAFLGKVAALNIDMADVNQKTTGPFYNHQESIIGFHHSPDGSFGVIKLSAEFNIPLPVMGVQLLHWEFSASSITGSNPQVQAQLQQLLAYKK